MPFKKGQKKPENSGRKPGSVNKRTLMMDEIFERFEDPLVALNKIAHDPSLEASLRVNALKEICAYKWAKKREAEQVLDVSFDTMGPRKFFAIMIKGAKDFLVEQGSDVESIDDALEFLCDGENLPELRGWSRGEA